jgi:hypothetical protein
MPDFVSVVIGLVLGVTAALACALVWVNRMRRNLVSKIGSCAARIEGPGIEREIEAVVRPEHALEYLEDVVDRLRETAGAAEESLFSLRLACETLGLSLAIVDVTGHPTLETAAFARLRKTVGEAEIEKSLERLVRAIVEQGRHAAGDVVQSGDGSVYLDARPLDSPKKRLGIAVTANADTPEGLSLGTVTSRVAGGLESPEIGHTPTTAAPNARHTEQRPDLTDFVDVARAVLAELQDDAQLRGVKLSLFAPRTADSYPKVARDPEAVHNVFFECTEIALRHARPGSVVELGISASTETVFCWVAYEGSQLPESLLPVLPSNRGDVGGDISEVHVSSGRLEKLAEAAGARIEAENVNGIGARLLLYFPAKERSRTRKD